MAPRADRERGCGCGCAVALLAIVIILLCLLMPWIGLPLGLIAAAVAILVAWLSGRGPFAGASGDIENVRPADAVDESEADNGSADF